ncbi:MAG TPA: immunoglobulin domain-containing protein, partial [Candidatus Saccharimonadales bacterium]|nr:immunoglobulin domain-containing protein [Candidatus Saccharimonadales bacterium]
MKKLFYSMLCLFSVLMAGTKLKAQPVITTQPVAAAEFTPNGESNPTSYTNLSCLYLGNTADLSVVATGALTYQWTLNGTPITDATGTNYSLDDIQATQAGEYACVVSNSGGGVTSS